MSLPNTSFPDTPPGSSDDTLHSSSGDYTLPTLPNTPGSPEFVILDANLDDDFGILPNTPVYESIPTLTNSRDYEILPADVKTSLENLNALENRLQKLIGRSVPPSGTTPSKLLKKAISQLEDVLAFDAQMLKQLSTSTTEKEREDLLEQYHSEVERRRMNFERLLCGSSC